MEQDKNLNKKIFKRSLHPDCIAFSSEHPDYFIESYYEQIGQKQEWLGGLAFGKVENFEETDYFFKKGFAGIFHIQWEHKGNKHHNTKDHTIQCKFKL